jgi:IPT/TIG domain/Bacterial Ig-like domain (group 2)/Galactose oxidase, central domain
MTVARWDQTATYLTNALVLFAGGYDSCSSTCISDGTTELFDPVTSTFTTSQPLSTGRSGHSATLLTDGSVLLVGGINNGVTLSSTDLYQPANLNLPQLASIVISPSAPVLTVGATLSLTATGDDINGDELNPLQSVIWSSSSPSVATVSNAAGSAGIIYTLSSGSTTITATVGTIVASINVTVTSPLMSITVGPSNPTTAVGSPQILNLTATGTYADGSTMDVTSQATWASSNSSIASVFDIPGNPAVVVPAAPGNTGITATIGSIAGSTNVTITMPLAAVPPDITGISPASGAAGTQVTISGSGFGASQNGGTVLIGTNLGIVSSWSDTQIVATVSTGSSSGVVQIQQTNGSSNSVPFTISTATIGGISPTCGVPGTQVTITGSGFGSIQGSGNIWLGTVPAIVNSWSDGEVVATVATGAATGNAQVLQNGVMSNAVPFTSNLPVITSISPNSGASGTVVTITGSGFGTTEGGGAVWIGNTYGLVTGWSNTQIVASVASNAVSGIVKVQQNGVWSNGVAFSVSSSGGPFGGSNSVTLVPNDIHMVVGGTQAIEALNSNGQSVTGLTWSSSNTAVVTLSIDDPPIVTAVGIGTATITAGNAASFVTVLPGAVLATGTVIWSNPGDGSGVQCIIPAVPSSTGVADVFALNSDGNVQAITASGMTAWTANVGTSVACSNLIPDFQGGLVVAAGSAIYRLDGMTGTQSSWTYTSVSGYDLPKPVVHTDGTIFTIDGSSVVGINPTTGMPNVNVSMNTSTLNSAPTYNPPSPDWIGNLIVAGDGYAYVPYQYSQSIRTQSTDSNTTEFLHVLRVGTAGDSYDIPVKQWSFSSTLTYTVTQSVPGGYAWCNDICQQWFGPNAQCSATANTMYNCAWQCLTLGGAAALLSRALWRTSAPIRLQSARRAHRYRQ